MTRQEVDRLTGRFTREATDDVSLERCLCDTVKGRMVCIWEAPDSDRLTAWLKQRQVIFRSDEEWLIPAQIDIRPPGREISKN